MTNTDRAAKYLVDFTTTIDRPELRGPTYPSLPAGTCHAAKAHFSSRKSALSFVEEILSGRQDSAGEIITSVRLTMAVTVRVFGGQSWREIVPRTARTRALLADTGSR